MNFLHGQAAYGRGAIAATSFFVYVGLGLGFLASSLSLPFGLFVLICQRNPEKYIRVRSRDRSHACTSGRSACCEGGT